MAGGPVSTPQVNQQNLTAGHVPTAKGDLGYANIVNEAANRWHVPAAILWGVFGLETGFGANVKNSSAGAVGPFQFLPSTAEELAKQGHPYPLTNTPSKEQFAQQADAAAFYLSTLKGQNGSWDVALHHYSGGGYGLSEVMKKFQSAPGVSAGTLDAGMSFIQGIATGPVGDVAAGIQKVLSVPEKFLALITSLDFWLRLGEGIAGLVLIGMGLRVLAGGSAVPNAVPVPV